MYASRSLMLSWRDKASRLHRADPGAYTGALADTPCGTANVEDPYFDFIHEPDCHVFDLQDDLGTDMPPEWTSQATSPGPSSVSSSSALQPRIKLVPKGPSGRQSRSPSPVRKQLALLEQASPPILLRQPDRAVAGTEQFMDLRRRLGMNFGSRIIPACLRDDIEKIDPGSSDAIQDYMIDETQQVESHDSQQLWQSVCQIYRMAKSCHDRHKDENAWARVITAVLELGISEARATRLEINSVQSQTIEPSLLSTHASGMPIAKKADFVFAFSPDVEEVETSYRSFTQQCPATGLSHMQDAYTRSIMLSYAIEVKEPGGNQSEATIQLAVFQSASLSKLRELAGDVGEKEMTALPPLLGWTVVGHEWKPYITYEVGNSVICQGPFDHLVAGTGSFRGIFALLDLIKRSCQVLEDSVWPVYKELLVRA